MVAKVEWHRRELYVRVGFIVTNLRRPAERNMALDAAFLPPVPPQTRSGSNFILRSLADFLRMPQGY